MALPQLFDANGQVGYGARSRPDFPTCRDLLKHMDRLGIARSLVWSTTARDQHPATGNRRLLAELDSLEAASRRRLTPSLVIAPTMLYEPGAVDDLARSIQSGIRALRVFPATLRHRLQHLEPLLHRIKELKPVLFIDIREVSNDQDLLQLAESLPDMPMVCMYGMWPHLFNLSLLNVLRRRPNVRIDTSWLHTGGTLELIVREFGPDRLVFSTGWKAHNGASIAHLLAAPIDKSVRDGIACRNLEKLLALKPDSAPLPREIPDPETLWGKFLSGRFPKTEIIDAHAHLGAFGCWPKEEIALEDQVAAMLRHMDRLGIRTMFLSGEDALFGESLSGNLSLEKIMAAHVDRFRGYFAFNPLYADALAPRLEEFLSRPFWAGIKLLCDYWQIPVTDPRLEPAYAFAHAHRLPILLHTWDGPYDSPAMLSNIVRKFPGAFFLLAHSGGGDKGRREAVALAKANPNVFLEWCGSFCSSIPWEETIAQVGSDRVVFGTDALGHSIDWELGRLVSLDLPPASILPILGDNLRRILKARK
jgi:hypothetical protein